MNQVVNNHLNVDSDSVSPRKPQRSIGHLKTVEKMNNKMAFHQNFGQIKPNANNQSRIG